MLNVLDTSKQMIRGLHDPAAYPHAVHGVDEIETHISWVLMAGDFAYKIKKPVDLGFADFSSLEKRLHCCEEELRLNRRLCPELYLDVVPITGTADAPRFSGNGAPIDYAVQMKQFSQERLLSRLIEQGELHADQIDRLAKQVAEFHAKIPSDDTTDCGTPEIVREFAEQNFDAIVESGSRALDRDAVDALSRWSQAEYAKREDEIRRRKSEGFVRECHGDMHLGNMVADNGDVLIFDCIEFNDHLRWIDVMDEAAFVVMDLEDRGRPDFAIRFLNEYLSRSGDYAGLQVLPYFLVYRAMVRAKVAMLRCRQMESGSPEAEEVLTECRGYLALARQYSQPHQPRLAITHGLSGSGKTTGSQRFVEENRAIRIRTDVERKRVLGLGVDEPTAPEDREHAYSAEITQQTYARVLELSRGAIQAGYSVVADATFLKQKYRNDFHRLADELNVPFQILDFQADVATLRERITRRNQSSHDASEADLRVLELQIAREEPLGDDERSFITSASGAASAPR